MLKRMGTKQILQCDRHRQESSLIFQIDMCCTEIYAAYHQAIYTWLLIVGI
jgi:hypothetical protein